MEATQRRLLQGLGLAALAVGGLTAGACIHPPAPVHGIVVQRSDEPARTGGDWFSQAAVVYRLGVPTEELERLQDGKGQVRFKVRRCVYDGREVEVPAAVEPAAPGAPLTWIRAVVPRRQIDEGLHCGQFVRRPRFAEAGDDDTASTTVQLQPNPAEPAAPAEGSPTLSAPR